MESHETICIKDLNGECACRECIRMRSPRIKQNGEQYGEPYTHQYKNDPNNPVEAPNSQQTPNSSETQDAPSPTDPTPKSGSSPTSTETPQCDAEGGAESIKSTTKFSMSELFPGRTIE